jgi:hypothetical protein
VLPAVTLGTDRVLGIRERLGDARLPVERDRAAVARGRDRHHRAAPPCLKQRRLEHVELELELVDRHQRAGEDVHRVAVGALLGQQRPVAPRALGEHQDLADRRAGPRARERHVGQKPSLPRGIALWRLPEQPLDALDGGGVERRFQASHADEPDLELGGEVSIAVTRVIGAPLERVGRFRKAPLAGQRTPEQKL